MTTLVAYCVNVRTGREMHPEKLILSKNACRSLSIHGSLSVARYPSPGILDPFLVSCQMTSAVPSPIERKKNEMGRHCSTRYILQADSLTQRDQPHSSHVVLSGKEVEFTIRTLTFSRRPDKKYTSKCTSFQSEVDRRVSIWVWCRIN